MVITITPQTIITAGAVVGALSALAALVVKLVRWVDRQKAQDKEIKALQAQKASAEELQELRAKCTRDQEAVQLELSMLTYGVYCCLKGLQEQGCNGPVTEAIKKLELYINAKAHAKANKEEKCDA